MRSDVIVVGGGPAGLTAAVSILDADPSLAGRVRVLEKARYPREKYCAGAIGGRGEKILARLGILPKVPGVPIEGMALRVSEGERTVRVGEIGHVVRRIEFDEGIARLAKDRGVEIVEDAKVEHVEADREGAIVSSSAGTFEARVVVGCDGVGSVVRKAIGLGPGTLRAQVLELDTESVPGDRERGVIFFDATDRELPGYTWDFPTVVGGRALVCRGIYHLKLGDEQVDLGKKLGERLATMGLDITSYKNKRFAERGVDVAETFAKGPLMLAGEAAGIDPITGEGIAQAVEYGSMVGPHVALALRGETIIESWTGRVRRSRLGRDLRIRERLVREFYGPRRPELERVLVADESFVHAGCRHFGALPMDPWPVARALARLGGYFALGVLAS
ncbi:MAG TPA: FAD-dependent monooxygenase [Polyangiaceae bacterium]|jgi:flavin-dependent dehydrogenase